MAIAANDLETLMPVLNVIARVAINGAPSPIPRSQPLHHDSVAGQFSDSTFGNIDELARQIRENHPDIPDMDAILTSGVPRAANEAGNLCDNGPPEKPCHSPRAATRQQVVLVVEDEILIRLTIANYLRDAGYSVVEAANAAEALAVFASGEPVDVVFTDVQMPGAMDGLMLVHWVHEHHPGTQVLVTSGKGDTALSSGLVPYDAFFSKPYPPEEVANRIHSLLGPDETGLRAEPLKVLKVH
jgi:CheY-like chemotaxis protein